VKINIINLQNKIRINSLVSSGIKKVALKTLSLEGNKNRGEISICLVTDKIIKKLNKKYLDHAGPTDVISFKIPQSNSIELIAEIAISTDTVFSNSKIFKTTPLNELFFYVAHAILHVLGYNDNTQKKRILMFKKQEKICQSIKLKL